MASSTLNRKAMSSSHHSSYSSTSASNLDNNLDALLDDLQTSISPNKNDTLPRSHHYQQQQQQQLQQQQHKQQQYQTSSRTVDRSNSLSRKSPMRSASPAMRSMSPSQSSGGSRARTIEKYVSTGPAGTPSGIPGLEMLDEELKDVQPGQSKTVAYKQVSYHYDKQQEGQNLDSWSKSDKQFSRNDASIADDFSQRTFERSSSRSRDSPDFARNQQHQNKEIIYKADVSTKTIPAPLHRTASESRQTERDFKYLKETSARTEPSPALSRKNLHKSEQQATSEELRNVEYLPPNLAPGPNTKVTTTIKTYTYELPGAPENYLPPSSTTTSVTKNVNVDKAVSYTVPKSQEQSSTSEKAVRYHVEEQRYVPPAAVPAQQQSTSEKSVKYHVEEQRYVPPVASPQLGNNSEKAMRYQQVEEQRFVSPPVVSSQQSSKEQKIMKSYHVEEQRYVPPPSQHSTTSEKAVRYHVEEQRYVPPSTPVMQHSSSSNTSERRYHLEEQTSPRYVAASPTPVNKSSHHEEKMFVERRGYRQASPQPLSQQSTLNRSERYVQQSRDYPDHASSQRQERVVYQAERAASPVQSSLHNSSKHFEEQHYSTSSRPPKPAANYESSNNAHFYKYDEQIIGTRPFPTSERPASPRQQPPRRIEDLMASFDSEEMHHQQQQHHQEVVEKRETFHSKNGHITKEVEYIKHSPSNGTSTMRSSSKSVAGPPVYYPPGSAEFAKKEEAMARNGSEWTKEKAAYEHGSAENTKKKEKSKKKVVPVCLPLCCALPCVIM